MKIFLGLGAVLMVIMVTMYVITSRDSGGERVASETAAPVLPNELAVSAPVASPAGEAPADTNEPTNGSKPELVTVADQPRAGLYQPYSEQALATSAASKRVLFFHAGWCPLCRALDGDIVANVNNIPADVVIFKVDYDTETSLKRQFGITYQHQVVVLDKDGAAVGKPYSPNDLAELLARL